jgi:hypothetical protein
LVSSPSALNKTGFSFRRHETVGQQFPAPPPCAAAQTSSLSPSQAGVRECSADFQTAVSELLHRSSRRQAPKSLKFEPRDLGGYRMMEPALPSPRPPVHGTLGRASPSTLCLPQPVRPPRRMGASKI